MQTNDPSDQSLDAGKVFADNLGPSDHARVAQFRGQTGVVGYLSAMTNGGAALRTAIDGIPRPANGIDTPLWDAMYDSLLQLSPAGNRLALLAFSDGEDNASVVHNATAVRSTALARNVSVFAINLRNSDSKKLDDIALATGGSVFSTDDAAQLVKYYGVLGQTLSGRSTPCTVNITVSIAKNPAVSGPIGYGPGSNFSADVKFRAATDAQQGTVSTKLRFPYYPGRKIGVSDTSIGVPRDIFETDFIEDTSDNCLESLGNTIRNKCASPSVAVSVCSNANPSDCRTGILDPGESYNTGLSSYTFGVCAWGEHPLQWYFPVQQIGTSPIATFSRITSKAQLASYLCISRAGEIMTVNF